MPVIRPEDSISIADRQVRMNPMQQSLDSRTGWPALRLHGCESPPCASAGLHCFCCFGDGIAIAMLTIDGNAGAKTRVARFAKAGIILSRMQPIHRRGFLGTALAGAGSALVLPVFFSGVLAADRKERLVRWSRI